MMSRTLAHTRRIERTKVMAEVGDVVSVNGRKALVEDKYRNYDGETYYLVMYNLGESEFVFAGNLD